MEDNVLVSVIIPVYNVAPYLQEALTSVVEQTYGNLEIIIVDDGSTDGSERICEEFAEKDGRIRLIRQSNKGLSSARNAGLDIMNGEMVAFLDSDDFFHPRYISAMLTAMLRNRADIVVCRYSRIDENGSLQRKKRGEKTPSASKGVYRRKAFLRALFEEKVNVSVWNKMFRREIIGDTRFPEGHVFEDVDTLYRIVSHSDSIYVTNHMLYYYRVRKKSITGKCSIENAKDWLLAWSHFEDFLRKAPCSIITEQQLVRRRWKEIQHLLLLYAKCFQNAEERALAEGIRALTISHVKTRLKEGDWRVEICYRMLVCFPMGIRYMGLIYINYRRLKDYFRTRRRLRLTLFAK